MTFRQPYNPIADYGLIGDTHSTALIDRNGSIDWLCWPRHDSPALFLRLLDSEKGGSCFIEFDEVRARTRRYLPGTNILETSFTTRTGRAVLLDLMPVHPPETLPDGQEDQGPDGEAESRLIRLLRCAEGTIRGRFVVRPTFNYARADAALTQTADGVLFKALDQTLRANATGVIEPDGDAAVASFALDAGDRYALVLTHGEDDRRPPLGTLDHAFERAEHTRRYWEEWSARCTYQGPFRDQVVRSALCLKLLTYSPTGGIIAAPTTSLPEAVPGNRNFDYRFSWLRDASFTVAAFVRLGYTHEAAEFLRFLREKDTQRGRDLRLMYRIDGELDGEETLTHLEGWRGVGPVRTGNGAQGQKQTDIYGELLAALRDFLEAVEYDPPQKVNDRLPEVLPNLVAQAVRGLDQPDEGIWEVPDGPQLMLHSQAMIWVALHCAATIGRRISGIPEATLDGWERQAEVVRRHYLERGWNERRQAYTMSYGSDTLDASVLRLVLFGAIEPDDPRLRLTVEAIDRELRDGDLLYRYKRTDNLEGQEATFAACAFWRVTVMALMKRTKEASLLYERLLSRANDLGLFAEEIDAASGEQRGNFPQAFTHMAVINHALRLQRAIEQHGMN